MKNVPCFARGAIGPMLSSLISTFAFAQTGYFGIPDGFDYPADKVMLESHRNSQNLSALRKHSWTLFAGMTQMTPDGTPYWETWYRESEAFRPAGPTPQGPRRIIREFATPLQLRQTGLEPHAPGKSTMTFVLFNQETYDHIRTHGLYQKSKLQNIQFVISRLHAVGQAEDSGLSGARNVAQDDLVAGGR